MITKKYSDPGQEYPAFHITEVGNLEFVNPILHFSHQSFSHSLNLDRQFYQMHKEKFAAIANGVNADEIMDRILTKRAWKFSDEMTKKIRTQQLPGNLIDILNNDDKKAQCKILRGLKLSMDQLLLLTFNAYENFGYTYSTYTFHHLPRLAQENEMPRLVYIEEDGRVTKMGKTNLTDSQLKHIIRQKRVMIVKMIEKYSVFHCFFYTYQSIKGQEAGNLHHMHYISHAWNFTREQVLSKLKQRRYTFSSLPHIEFEDR